MHGANAVVTEDRAFGVQFDGVILKPNMVLPGSTSGEQAGPETVAPGSGPYSAESAA